MAFWEVKSIEERGGVEDITYLLVLPTQFSGTPHSRHPKKYVLLINV
jgi:hypothetical protein